MIVCVQCRIEMQCSKIGRGVRFGPSHVYPGDEFECPKCGAKIIKTNDSPVFDPSKKIETLQAIER